MGEDVEEVVKQILPELREQIAPELRTPRGIGRGAEPGEFLRRAFRIPPYEQDLDRIGVLQRMAQGEEDEFGFWRGNTNAIQDTRVVQKRILDREAVILDETVAAHDLEIRVKMHEFGLSL